MSKKTSSKKTILKSKQGETKTGNKKIELIFSGDEGKKFMDRHNPSEDNAKNIFKWGDANFSIMGGKGTTLSLRETNKRNITKKQIKWVDDFVNLINGFYAENGNKEKLKKSVIEKKIGKLPSFEILKEGKRVSTKKKEEKKKPNKKNKKEKKEEEEEEEEENEEEEEVEEDINKIGKNEAKTYVDDEVLEKHICIVVPTSTDVKIKYYDDINEKYVKGNFKSVSHDIDGVIESLTLITSKGNELVVPRVKGNFMQGGKVIVIDGEEDIEDKPRDLPQRVDNTYYSLSTIRKYKEQNLSLVIYLVHIEFNNVIEVGNLFRLQHEKGYYLDLKVKKIHKDKDDFPLSIILDDGNGVKIERKEDNFYYQGKFLCKSLGDIKPMKKYPLPTYYSSFTKDQIKIVCNMCVGNKILSNEKPFFIETFKKNPHFELLDEVVSKKGSVFRRFESNLLNDKDEYIDKQKNIPKHNFEPEDDQNVYELIKKDSYTIVCFQQVLPNIVPIIGTKIDVKGEELEITNVKISDDLIVMGFNCDKIYYERIGDDQYENNGNTITITKVEPNIIYNEEEEEEEEEQSSGSNSEEEEEEESEEEPLPDDSDEEEF